MDKVLTEMDRKRLLSQNDYHAYRHEPGNWGVMGYSGVVERGFSTKKEAEDFILENMGVLD